MSPLVLGDTLRVFTNTLTAQGKYPVDDFENLQLPIQMQLSVKRKTFCESFIDFLNLHQILNILKEKMIVIANLFPILQTVKNLIRALSKKRRFRTHFDIQHVRASQILAKSP